jgi:hypothetical protein
MGLMAQERPDERTAERRWAVTHTLATVLLIVWNGVSNSRRLFLYTVGEVSDLYPSSFTPAGYAFAIWGPIYLGLLAMCGFALRRAFSSAGGDASRRAFIAQLGAPFVGAQLACGLWLWAWLTDSILLSLLLMMMLWALLVWCVVRLDMERWDAPWSIIALVWWPMSLYSGWITVALLANVSAYLASLGVGLVTSPGWAISLALVLTAANLVAVWTRNMREFSMVAVWALMAVFVRFLGDADFASVRWTALAAAVILLGSSITHGVRNFSWPPRR